MTETTLRRWPARAWAVAGDTHRRLERPARQTAGSVCHPEDAVPPVCPTARDGSRALGSGEHEGSPTCARRTVRGRAGSTARANPDPVAYQAVCSCGWRCEREHPVSPGPRVGLAPSSQSLIAYSVQSGIMSSMARAPTKRFTLRGRSAKTGRFISLAQARKRKSTSIVERIPLPRRRRRSSQPAHGVSRRGWPGSGRGAKGGQSRCPGRDRPNRSLSPRWRSGFGRGVSPGGHGLVRYRTEPLTRTWIRGYNGPILPVALGGN